MNIQARFPGHPCTGNGPGSINDAGGIMKHCDGDIDGKLHEDTLKDETFDDFLLRAYNQLTPEEQTRIRKAR